MESYKTIYKLRIEHEYFEGMPCDSIECRLTSRGAELARMHRLLFRQTAVNEWTIMFDVNGNSIDGNEVLEMELFIKDPQFPLYTEWKGFNPRLEYEIDLPKVEECIDAAITMEKYERKSDEKKKFGAGFCLVSLSLSQELVETAIKGNIATNILLFKAPVKQWVYVFRRRENSIIPKGNLTLEDMSCSKSYKLTDNNDYGEGAKSVIIQKDEPLRKEATCDLHLVLNDNGRKRTLLTHIEPPKLGRYVPKRTNELLQVCYY